MPFKFSRHGKRNPLSRVLMLLATLLLGGPGWAQDSSPPPAVTAVCRPPQEPKREPGEYFAINTPTTQAEAWAEWMTAQLAAGRTQFIVVPIVPVGGDEGEHQDMRDSVLCAW